MSRSEFGRPLKMYSLGEFTLCSFPDLESEAYHSTKPVADSYCSVSLKAQLSLPDIESLINDVRKRVENDIEHDSEDGSSPSGQKVK